MLNLIAGKLKSLPKKVSIFGTGPAGLNAAFTAKDLQLPVQVFGRQESYRKQIEAAGIIYHVLPEKDQTAFIRRYLSNQTIIITAARNIGKKSPLLIDETTLTILPDNAVIVDLSAGEGGNVAGSKEDKVVTLDRNISIINVSGYPKTEPKAASEAYAQCMVNLLLEIMTSDGEIELNNALLRDSAIHNK